MPKPFFITTAIDYTNGAPHIGHAYEKVLADVLARYHRLKGDEVFFLTGVDQHGQKVQQIGGEAGRRAAGIRRWHHGEIRRAVGEARRRATTAGPPPPTPLHKECVRANLQRLWDDKVPASTERGSTKRARLLQRAAGAIPHRQGARPRRRIRPRVGPGRVARGGKLLLPARRASKQWLLDFIDQRSAEATARRPRLPRRRTAQRRGETRGRPLHLAPGVAAPVGHPVPASARFVTYVWFDALVNYISFAPATIPRPGRVRATRGFPRLVARRSTSSARTSSSPRTASIGRSC